MTLLPWLIGSALALVVMVTAWSWRRYPSRARCPRCASATSPVTLPRTARPFTTWLHGRWCSACGWEGFGRKGPDFDPERGPAAHDSGFRWSGGDADTGVPGFQWGGTASPDAEAPEAHPSGFQWAATDSVDEADSTSEEPAPPAHPSGFRWSQGSEAPHPLRAFRWREQADSEDAPAPGFRWKE